MLALHMQPHETSPASTDHVVHVCAGSGSVPNLSILTLTLEHHPELRHTFIYSNKTWDDVIFRDTLADLAARHPERLKVVHTLTREENAGVFGPTVRKGRLDQAASQERFFPMRDVPVGRLDFRGQPLPSVADGASEFLRRVPLKEFSGMRGKRLLPESQLRCIDGHVACGASIHPIQILDDELLDAPA